MDQFFCRVHGGAADDQEAKDHNKEYHDKDDDKDDDQTNDEEAQALKPNTNKPLMNFKDHRVPMKDSKTL